MPRAKIAVQPGVSDMCGTPSYIFPAVRGIQATREYYVTMCPLRLVPRILTPSDQGFSPELRAQRRLNKGRIPALSKYILQNPKDYVFASIVASIDGEVEFIPISEDPALYDVGHLYVPTSARFIINDGQHRSAAIQVALRERPELGYETIACVLFVDTGLKRSQQVFADLNRYAIRPTPSLSIMYDHRDPLAGVVRQVVQNVPIFNSMTEIEKSSISTNSRKLFTLSGIYLASRELLADLLGSSPEELIKTATLFWMELSNNISEWQKVKNGEISAAQLRKEYIHAHTVTLIALGRAGRSLLACRPEDWRKALIRLGEVDWRRNNWRQWEGRAMVGGKMANSPAHICLLSSEIKRILGLRLTAEEQKLEAALAASKSKLSRGEVGFSNESINSDKREH